MRTASDGIKGRVLDAPIVSPSSSNCYGCDLVSAMTIAEHR